MYGAASDPKTRQIVEGADLVLDLGGVNLNDITTAAYSGKLEPARFIRSCGLPELQRWTRYRRCRPLSPICDCSPQLRFIRICVEEDALS